MEILGRLFVALNAENFHSQLWWTQNSLNALEWQRVNYRENKDNNKINIYHMQKKFSHIFTHCLFSVLLQGLNHVLKFTFSLRAPKLFSSTSQNKWIGNHSADKLIQFTGTWTTHNFNICNVFGNNGKNLYALEQTLKFYPRERQGETYG